MRIAVMGAGGVGGYFGALLARAGHEVTFVARGAHLAAIQQHGLRVESTLDGTFTVPGRAVGDTTQAGPQDLVLFTVKMYDNAAALAATEPLLRDDTIVLTLQNGIDNGEQLAAAYGAPRIMIGSAYMEGRVKEPGVVTQAGPGAAAFGEMTPGITPRAQRCAARLPRSWLACGSLRKYARDAVEEICLYCWFRRRLRGDQQ